MGEGRMFCVSGSEIYEVFADGMGQLLGDVGDDEDHTPAEIYTNGNDLLVISAGYAWRVWVEDDGVTTHANKVKLIAAEYTDLAIAVTGFIYDLEIDPDDTTKVASSGRPFTAEDVDLNLHITSGIDFTPGTYYILSVTDGVASLDGAAGVEGATGGVAEIIDTAKTDWVSSPTIPFIDSDVGNTLIIDPASPAGFGGGGTYTILAVEDGMAQLSTGVGVAGTLGGIAVQYPGESAETDADGYIKAGTGAYLDGYGIVAPPPQPRTLTNMFLISEIRNFAKWYALDKGTKEGYADNILALLADHEELIIFGDLESGEVWRNTGASNFPFERNMGAFMHFGLAAQHSVARLGMNGIAWLGWSAGRGAPQAYYAAGFQPQRISTPMLEHLWDQYPNVRDARAFSYIEDGHHFWQITFPEADITWCFDFTASEKMGKPMWHARASWSDDAWHRVRANCHTYGYFLENEEHAGGTWTRHLTHFVGDWENSSIYVQGLYNFTDAGTPIRRQMQSIHMANENKRTVWNLFQLECRVGDGGEDIEWTLDYSRDRGGTFVNPRDRLAAGDGDTHQRLRWWRCGQSYDQVWRLTTESPAKVSITSAWFDATECEH
jgi:hypothetical protein